MSDSIFFKVFASGAAGENPAVFANAGDADWTHAVDQAVLHQCVPLFRQYLRDVDALRLLPEVAREQLEYLTRYSGITNLQGLHQLHELMARLNGEIPLI